MPKPTFIAPDTPRTHDHCVGCKRKLAWAYALCYWCREQRLEDIAAETSDESDAVCVVERSREAGRLRITPLGRTRWGSLCTHDNYRYRADVQREDL